MLGYRVIYWSISRDHFSEENECPPLNSHQLWTVPQWQMEFHEHSLIHAGFEAGLMLLGLVNIFTSHYDFMCSIVFSCLSNMFHYRCPVPLAVTIFLPPFLRWTLSLVGRKSDITVPFRTEHSISFILNMLTILFSSSSFTISTKFFSYGGWEVL